MLLTKKAYRILGIVILLFVVLLALVLMSDGFFGGGDSIAHYRIAHYAWKYPHLFLDHWGKPVFTLLSSPFSQLGFNGIRIYNILAGLLAGYLTYLVAEGEKRKDAWLALFFVVCAPVFFILFFSAMTEITFALVLIFSVYFVYRGKYTAAALIISFLPFARTEGVVIVGVFAGGLLWYRQFKSLPYLLAGFVLFSGAGWPVYHDPLWVIHRMPYTGAADIYGHGRLTHFVKQSPRIFGIPLLLFWVAGLVSLLRDLTIRRKCEEAWREVWFVVLPFLTYFAAHSYVWWKGIGGSLGLIRVMAGIVPLAAVTAIRGYDLIAQKIPGKRFVSYLLPVLTLGALLIPPLHYHKVPLQEDETQKLLTQAADWVKHSPYAGHLVYYYDLYFQFKLGVDPYDMEKCREKVPDPHDPAREVPPGSIVQWDAHYAPNEGRLPLEKLMDNPAYELLKAFKPEHPFKVMGGFDYSVYIFLRKPDTTDGE